MMDEKVSERIRYKLFHDMMEMYLTEMDVDLNLQGVGLVRKIQKHCFRNDEKPLTLTILTGFLPHSDK